MIHFVWPWLCLALPYPWLIRQFMPAIHPIDQAALKVPFLEDFTQVQSHQSFPFKKPWVLWLAIMAWCLLILASTKFTM